MATRITRPTTRPAAPPALPGDVRLMNLLASALFVCAALAAVAVALTWLARSPRFAIHGIRVEGQLHRIDADVLRANAAPRLSGNFFSADLDKARAAFEAVPWVRRASVRRVWPDRLVVQIEEHQVAALWQVDESDDRLVNRQGEVFSANVGDVEDEALPTFNGPEGSAAAMLALFQRVLPVLRRLDMEIEQLQQSSRGSWRALLDNGTTLEFGRGTVEEVAIRTERFVSTLPQVTERYRTPLEYADLRHVDGYAVRLRGVTTTAPGGTKPAL
jgi:cell division protein FtsQ